MLVVHLINKAADNAALRGMAGPYTEAKYLSAGPCGAPVGVTPETSLRLRASHSVKGIVYVTLLNGCDFVLSPLAVIDFR